MLRATSLTVLLSAALAHAAPPATAPQQPPEESMRPQLVAEQATMPKLESQRISQLLSMTVEEGFLRVSVRGLNEQRGQFAVQVPDLPGFVSLRNDGNAFYTFDHWLLTENDTVTSHTTLSVRPDYLQISRDIETPGGITNITLLQSRQFAADGAKPVRLIVSRHSNDAQTPRRSVNVAAATFNELIREEPAPAREFLLPMLRDLGAADVMHAADPARAWQALGALIPPDPTVAKQVDEILPRLNSDDFADRVKAEEQLQALGPAGASELRRRDLTKLPIDTRSSVDNALRLAEPLTPDRAKELASDVPFLLDTLVLSDPRLVSAAAQQLQTITGKPIKLPADLSPEERLRRIASYTATLGPATQPVTATQPVPDRADAP